MALQAKLCYSTQEISLVFVAGFIMNRRNYYGGVPGTELFRYVYLSRNLVIVRTVNRIKRTSDIITVNLGTLLAIHNLERKNILRPGLTT